MHSGSFFISRTDPYQGKPSFLVKEPILEIESKVGPKPCLSPEAINYNNLFVCYIHLSQIQTMAQCLLHALPICRNQTFYFWKRFNQHLGTWDTRRRLGYFCLITKRLWMSTAEHIIHLRRRIGGSERFWMNSVCDDDDFYGDVVPNPPLCHSFGGTCSYSIERVRRKWIRRRRVRELGWMVRIGLEIFWSKKTL
jgi:hypothetical protein